MRRVRHNPLRTIRKLIGFTALIVEAGLSFLWNKLTRKATRRYRNHWLQMRAQRALRLLNVSIAFHGELPKRGVVVCNHLSYVDIVVLSALFPATFVSKSEVKWWPIIGWLTQCAGTLYVRRRDKSDLKRLHEPMNDILQEGGILVMFPEGTSSDGSQVLPFHSSLFEPMATRNHAITPVWITYGIEDGSAEDEVCYWRDMTFAPHLLNLFAIEKIQATVELGSARTPLGQSRKQLAKDFHARVSALAIRHHSRKTASRQ